MKHKEKFGIDCSIEHKVVCAQDVNEKLQPSSTDFVDGILKQLLACMHKSTQIRHKNKLIGSCKTNCDFLLCYYRYQDQEIDIMKDGNMDVLPLSSLQ